VLKRIKQTIFVILILGAGALLATPAKQREPIPPGRVVVTYWEKWTGREGDQLKQIVDWFNATDGKEKNIWVNLISISSIDQKTITATSAGVPPDVAGLWQAQLVQFAAMNTLEPLDEMASAHGITKGYYKPVYWDMCNYDGHWNKQAFLDRAKELRAAGLDPLRAPRTIDEFNRYADALNVWNKPKDQGGRIIKAGYLVPEPGWYVPVTPVWWGAEFYDAKTRKLTFTTPRFVAAFAWMARFSQVMGVSAMLDFRSGLPQLNTFDSPQNPFLSGLIAMEQQGPWMANYIEKDAPQLNRWKMSKEQERTLPREQRKQNYQWGVAAFPSAMPGMEDVSFADADILVIPRGAAHKKEAFEFISFMQRQDVMEKLCSMHCKNSPLAKVSADFIENHPNPYIDVFEKLAASPDARGNPQIPIWPEISAELLVTAERVYMLKQSPEQALRDAQNRLQAHLDYFYAMQDLHKKGSSSGEPGN
jgi:ABC-type glycerol-3-phosphate transport system substrate-binding protein